jgi:hypothetical protein
VPIIRNVMSSNPTHGELYSIQHYVRQFVSVLRQVSVFRRVFRFPLPKKNWPPRYSCNIVESGVKHYKPPLSINEPTYFQPRWHGDTSIKQETNTQMMASLPVPMVYNNMTLHWQIRPNQRSTLTLNMTCLYIVYVACTFHISYTGEVKINSHTLYIQGTNR